jgi:uncharacterized protein YegP (UPF0339 family)
MYFEIYIDASRIRWRWRLKAANHLVIADSGQGYFNKADCLHGISLVQQSSIAPVYAA